MPGYFRRVSPVSAALMVGGVVYSIFIARSLQVVEGQPYFTLFDDAMISMRYARNLARGQGLVFNPGGPPVEGYSNTLWTGLMASVHLLPIPAAFVSVPVMVLGLITLLVTAVLTGLLTEVIAGDRPHARLIGTVAALVYYPLVFWTLRGMEVGLLAMLLTAATLFALQQERRWTTPRLAWQAAVLSCAVMTRDDALVAIIILCGYSVLAAPRPKRTVVFATLFGVLIATLTAHEVFRLVYYHALLPNTYALKVGGVPLSDRVGRGLTVLFILLREEAWFPLILVLWGIAGARGAQLRPRLLLAAVVGAQLVYMVYVGGDAWEFFGHADRFIAAVMPLALALSAAAAADLLGGHHSSTLPVAVLVTATAVITTIIALDLTRGTIVAASMVGLIYIMARRKRTSGQWRQPPLAAVLVFGLMVVELPLWGAWSLYNARYLPNLDVAYVETGLRLRAATRPNAVIAGYTAGSVPYFSERRFVDLLGKTDPVVAAGPSREPFVPGHSKWNYRYSVCTLRPDVVAGLWEPTRQDRELISRCGYDALEGGGYYVRHDSRLVERARL